MATTTSSKPVLSALKTPLSATYPSELQSPLVATPTSAVLVKREEDLKTPITPPSAYLDFLKALSPALMSPLATGTSSRFSFSERPALSTASSQTSVSSAPASVPAKESTSAPDGCLPDEKPASPGVTPSASRASSCCSCDSQSKPEKRSNPQELDKDKPKDSEGTTTTTKSTTPPTAPPQSPFVRPLSARTPRLRIPQSPYSPGRVQSPMSAHSVQSPFSASMSPREWDWEKAGKPPGSATSRAVSVRQVVTRTVTYSRTPVDAAPPAQLDPAPKGKRRKIA